MQPVLCMLLYDKHLHFSSHSGDSAVLQSCMLFVFSRGVRLLFWGQIEATRDRGKE
jgi:hypothetical protein